MDLENQIRNGIVAAKRGQLALLRMQNDQLEAGTTRLEEYALQACGVTNLTSFLFSSNPSSFWQVGDATPRAHARPLMLS